MTRVVRSLRLQLGIALGVVLAAVVAGFALAIHAVTARALLRDLDERLAGDASAVAGMVERGENGGGPQLEYESLRDFEPGAAPGYYEIWLNDGRVLSRSPSLGARDLSRESPGGVVARYRDVTLPDGRPGRSIQVRTAPRVEDATAPDAAPTGPGPTVTVVVAQSTAPMLATLRSVRSWLWALALATLATGASAMFLALSRGLRPVRTYADALSGLDDQRLTAIASASALPSELDPIREKLEELLARLAESFARERRFTADVAHELRTPLAALRAIVEVAQSRERSAEAYRAAIAEAEQVTGNMALLVDDLLLMCRLDNRQVPIRPRPVVLRQIVDDCWAPLAARGRQRGLSFSNDVDPEASVHSDPDKLRIVVSNLLANAVEYTSAAGRIAVRGSPGSAGIEVWDSGPEIPADVMPRIFDRFFRADPSRTGEQTHAGIGLSLARSISNVLGLELTARNAPAGGVSFRVEPRATSAGN